MKAAIIGIAGSVLSPDEAALFRQQVPAGAILFARNIETPSQLAALLASLRAVLPPQARLLVDQEGGRVARLRPPHWPARPAAARLGALHEADPTAGLRAAWLTGALIGLDCAGFDVVCAPVLDLAVPGATPAIGDRAYAADPARVAALGGAVADGLLAAGIEPVAKHAPGHGRARADSHAELPRIPAGTDLEPDLAPFQACAGLPWMMTAHLLYQGLDPNRPATLSPTIIDHIIRGRIGFDGVLVSDDLAMHALVGPPGARAATALAAGCDLALHCSGRLDDTRDVLAAIPPASVRTLARLAAARARADASRMALDKPALEAELQGLLR